MGKLTIANLKKTIYFLKRNGLKNTWNEARGRLKAVEHYAPKVFTEEELDAMRQDSVRMIREAKEQGKTVPFFHVLVPAYRTDPKFLKELIESVQSQVYSQWELLILDATEGEEVHEAVEKTCSEIGKNDGLRGAVRYLRLPSNGGISENTNAGLPYVKEDYVGLLDHDDVLTPDALYEMALAILSGGEDGAAASNFEEEKSCGPVMLYSDEDKWDGEGKYYERNRKEDFNLDLLLSNNYVCHFLVMKTELFRELKLRKEFDGAQDYDLVLRAAAWIMERGGMPEKEIRHVPKVLYHWRCHGGSTAENPQSKLYAYEAGRRALQDFADCQGWHAKAEDLKHLGFYRLRFDDVPKLLEERGDLGAVGGKLLANKMIAGGRMAEDGSVYYEGLKEEFSGYLHRAVLTQDAEAVDLRCICVAKEFWPLFEEIVGVPYVTRTIPAGREERSGGMDKGSATAEIFDAGTLPEGADVKALSLKLCKALREQGKRILWDPELFLRT